MSDIHTYITNRPYARVKRSNSATVQAAKQHEDLWVTPILHLLQYQPVQYTTQYYIPITNLSDPVTSPRLRSFVLAMPPLNQSICSSKIKGHERSIGGSPINHMCIKHWRWQNKSIEQVESEETCGFHFTLTLKLIK